MTRCIHGNRSIYYSCLNIMWHKVALAFHGRLFKLEAVEWFLSGVLVHVCMGLTSIHSHTLLPRKHRLVHLGLERGLGVLTGRLVFIHIHASVVRKTCGKRFYMESLLLESWMILCHFYLRWKTAVMEPVWEG